MVCRESIFDGGLMAKKVKIKTTKNNSSVAAFVKGIGDKDLKKDCQVLLKVFKKASGLKPKMWGTAIVGFGEYTYYRSNGDEGSFLAAGFSPRKSGPTIYLSIGYAKYASLLRKLGPHKLSKSCLYMKKIEDIDLQVLELLVKKGISDLKKKVG